MRAECRITVMDALCGSYHYYCPLWVKDGDHTTLDYIVCNDIMGPQVFDAIDQVPAPPVAVTVVRVCGGS